MSTEPLLLPQVDPAKLKQARLEKDLRQDDLAAALSVSRSQICNIEKAVSIPNANDLAIWARTCGKSVEWFYTDAAPNGFAKQKKSLQSA